MIRIEENEKAAHGSRLIEDLADVLNQLGGRKVWSRPKESVSLLSRRYKISSSLGLSGAGMAFWRSCSSCCQGGYRLSLPSCSASLSPSGVWKDPCGGATVPF